MKHSHLCILLSLFIITHPGISQDVVVTDAVVTSASAEPLTADELLEDISAERESAELPGPLADLSDLAVTILPDAGATVATTATTVEGDVVVTTTENPARAPGISTLPAPANLQLEELPDGDVVLEMPGGTSARSTVSRDAETISVDFPDEEVRTIVRNVADLYDLNVVIPDTLVGSVSLKLRNVTWRQVFDVALAPMGYTYIEEGNIIKIKSRQELLQEPVDTRVFIINFATASDLRGAIEPLIDAVTGGRIQVDVRSNALIITERPSRMSNIIEIIERLDRPTEQVMIESKFVEVTTRELRNVGVNWASLSGWNAQGSVGGQRTDTNTSTRSSSNSLSRTIPVDGSGNVSTLRTIEDTVTSLDELVREDTAVFSTDAFNVLLSALQTNDNIELISNPTVVTMNNTPAAIHIGEQYPIPNYTYNPERGTFEISNFEYKDFGIKLNVLPQVNSAGFVTMAIKPEISSATGEVSFGGASGATIPIVTRRTTESTVTLKTGFTLAIGGLVEKTQTTVDSKVPVLGDIPLLGRAFKHKSNSEDTRNLIIFITAKVLNADGSTYRDVFSQRRLYEMGIKERDLPGYTPTQEEEALFNQLQETRDEIERLQAQGRLRAQLEQMENSKNSEVEKQVRQNQERKSR